MSKTNGKPKNLNGTECVAEASEPNLPKRKSRSLNEKYNQIYLNELGLDRLPKASDYKLPKKLSELDKKRIAITKAVNRSLLKAYRNEQKAKG